MSGNIHDVTMRGPRKQRDGTADGRAVVDVRGMYDAVRDGYRAAMRKRGLSVGFNGRRHGGVK